MQKSQDSITTVMLVEEQKGHTLKLYVSLGINMQDHSKVHGQ